MPVFKCPKSEESMVRYVVDGETVGYVTRKIGDATKLFLYMIQSGGWKKVKTSNNPIGFDDIVFGGK